MAKRQDPRREHPTSADKDDGYEKRHDHDHDGDEGERSERQIFVDLVQRRLGGGATPTAETYAKAMQQWLGLAGAVQFVAVPMFPTSDSGATTTPAKPSDKPNDGVDSV